VFEKNHSKIVLLGTGTPNADPDRSGPSVAIVVEGQAYLVDFGPGVVRRASAAYAAGIDALEPNKLNIAFLTHLHSDHTAGYPDLILTPWVLGREVRLQVFGPPGLKSMTDHILSAYQADIHQRIHGKEPANDTGYKVNVAEIKAGKVYQDRNIMVEAFLANHGSWPAFGFKFTTPDRTIVLSGDTAPHPGLIAAYRDCDVLIHEVYSDKGFHMHPPDWRNYHRSVHTSARELGEIAAQVNPRLLILYHQLLWGVSPGELIDEIRAIYHGKVIFGNDLDVF
jgi:ribonuclease BN (tRNA processing enzyme)